MKILYITQYFTPEPGAAAIRAREFAENWVQAGVDITILTGFPNYLEGKIYQGYKNTFVSKERWRDIEVIRTKTLAYPRGSIFLRIISQINFIFWVFLYSFCLKNIDIIVISSPPFPLCIVGLLIGWIKKVPWVFEVRDLFPDSAVAFGVIKNDILIKLLRKLDVFIYKKCSRVVAATMGLSEEIINKGIDSEKVLTIMNGVNIDMFSPNAQKEDLKKYFKNEDIKYIILYSGLIGKAHGADILLDSANELKGRDDIGFVFVGDGPEKRILEIKKKEYALKNIIFLDKRSYEDIPIIINSSDIGFASLINTKFTEKSIPIKIFDYMASAKPVLLLGKGEAARILEKANAGICVKEYDPKKLADTIVKLVSSDLLRNQFGENGRKFVEENFSRKKIALSYLNELNKLV